MVEDAEERLQDAGLLTLFPCFMICTSDSGIPMFQHAPVPSRKTAPWPFLIILNIKFYTILYTFILYRHFLNGTEKFSSGSLDVSYLGIANSGQRLLFK